MACHRGTRSARSTERRSSMMVSCLTKRLQWGRKKWPRVPRAAPTPMAPPSSSGKRRAADRAEMPASKKKSSGSQEQVQMVVDEGAGIGPALGTWLQDAHTSVAIGLLPG